MLPMNSAIISSKLHEVQMLDFKVIAMRTLMGQQLNRYLRPTSMLTWICVHLCVCVCVICFPSSSFYCWYDKTSKSWAIRKRLNENRVLWNYALQTVHDLNILDAYFVCDNAHIQSVKQLSWDKVGTWTNLMPNSSWCTLNENHMRESYWTLWCATVCDVCVWDSIKIVEAISQWIDFRLCGFFGMVRHTHLGVMCGVCGVCGIWLVSFEKI